MRALRSSFRNLEEKTDLVRVENESVKRKNEDMMERFKYGSNKNSMHCVDSLVNELPRKYIGAPLTVEK